MGFFLQTTVFTIIESYSVVCKFSNFDFEFFLVIQVRLILYRLTDVITMRSNFLNACSICLRTSFKIKV